MLMGTAVAEFIETSGRGRHDVTRTITPVAWTQPPDGSRSASSHITPRMSLTA
jgi:hypothetical protein